MKGDDFRIQQLPDIYQPSWTFVFRYHLLHILLSIPTDH